MRSVKLKDTVRSRFIVAESNSLLIETFQTDSLSHRQHLRLLKLKGTWRANDYNQLIFEVSGKKGPPEIFTFKGIWKLNKNQQIEYTSENGRDTLFFKGDWQIFPGNRLVYVLEGSLTSRFEFKAQMESASFTPKKGCLRYRVGVGGRQNRLTGNSLAVIVYGEWKFGRNLGLVFQADCRKGKIKSVEFAAQVTFGRQKLDFALKNEIGQPLGVTLTLTHKFLKSFDAQAFIKLTSRRQEQSLETGFSIPF